MSFACFSLSFFAFCCRKVLFSALNLQVAEQKWQRTTRKSSLVNLSSRCALDHGQKWNKANLFSQTHRRLPVIHHSNYFLIPHIIGRTARHLKTQCRSFLFSINSASHHMLRRKQINWNAFLIDKKNPQNILCMINELSARSHVQIPYRRKINFINLECWKEFNYKEESWKQKATVKLQNWACNHQTAKIKFSDRKMSISFLFTHHQRSFT